MNGPLPYYLTTDEPSEQRYRTVFISDIHLGTAGCQATELLEFLKSFECETLYLVGDIVDGWQLRRRWHWPQAHNDVEVKRAVSFVTAFEEALANAARKRGFDGVVCGHIHRAEIRMIGDVLYCNDGDWVESLTALVEHADGRLEIIDWTEMKKLTQRSESQLALELKAGLKADVSS
ncbi:MAG: UDP-2,3-diacylglucosamine diphosphatase [Betaproteobacteria bacterium]|nr:UDP-2,3-diacylglucosamine diphosphatase [Betaproteobacteria bacterium]